MPAVSPSQGAEQEFVTRQLSSSGRARDNMIRNSSPALTDPAYDASSSAARRDASSPHFLQDAIDALDERSVRALLLGAAQANADLGAVVLRQYAAEQATASGLATARCGGPQTDQLQRPSKPGSDAEIDKQDDRSVRIGGLSHTVITEAALSDTQPKAVDFDYLSKSSWRTLNITLTNLRSMQEEEDALAVKERVLDDINFIKDSIHECSPCATKKSGLITLRKIGKSICLMRSGDLAKRTRSLFSEDNAMVTAMLHVINCMDDPERTSLVSDNEADIIAKLEELDTLQGQDIIFNLTPVLEALHNHPSRSMAVPP